MPCSSTRLVDVEISADGTVVETYEVAHPKDPLFPRRFVATHPPQNPAIGELVELTPGITSGCSVPRTGELSR